MNDEWGFRLAAYIEGYCGLHDREYEMQSGDAAGIAVREWVHPKGGGTFVRAYAECIDGIEVFIYGHRVMWLDREYQVDALFTLTRWRGCSATTIGKTEVSE